MMLNSLPSYRRDFAQECARYRDNPEQDAVRFETELVTLTSLQSEGRYKSEDSQNSSVLPRLTYQNLGVDQELTAVLQDVRSELGRQSGQADGFFYQPLVSQGNAVYGRAVRLDESRGLLQVYDVALHDTPGEEGGLLHVAPTESSDAIVRRARSTRGFDLDQCEAGWQYHKDAFPRK